MSFTLIVKKSLNILAFGALLFINGIILHFLLNNDIFKSLTPTSDTCVEAKCDKLGFDAKLFTLNERKFKSGQLFPDLLSDLGLDKTKITKVLHNLEGYMNMRSIRSGSDYTLVSSNECLHPDYLLYELGPSRILICDLSGVSCPKIIYKESEIKRESAFGTIKSSLWDALEASGVSLNIIDQMEDALATSVDFLHVQQGSSFKLVFDREWIEGEPSSNGTLLAAYFNTGNNEYHAFRYDVNGKFEYYDMNGRPLRRSFLQAPVRFSRISSGFAAHRFHPVLKYSRPHLGTDYAAPIGTPIMSVGNGVVVAASYSGGNGRFVKIRHDKTYETQYLHMSRFAAGIRNGSSVNQGQIIGYVGKSGLATGPHVCFRFWKNGIQVDHRKLKFPSGQPLPPAQMSPYLGYRDQMIAKLNAIQGSTAMLLPAKKINRS